MTDDSTPRAASVVVFASSDWAEVTMAKLLLDGEGIRYVAQGEGVQDLFAFGRVGGFNGFTGPVQLRVTSAAASLALEVLRELRQPDGVPDE